MHFEVRLFSVLNRLADKQIEHFSLIECFAPTVTVIEQRVTLFLSTAGYQSIFKLIKPGITFKQIKLLN